MSTNFIASFYGAGIMVFLRILKARKETIFVVKCPRIFWNQIFIQNLFGHKIIQSKSPEVRSTSDAAEVYV